MPRQRYAEPAARLKDIPTHYGIRFVATSVLKAPGAENLYRVE